MNNLFNDKLLSKKANEEVDLNKNNLIERRKYLDKWINMLEAGVLDKTKEEQLQGEFISDIFSKVLNARNITDGFEEWNLERETKTLLDGQKADGTLGFFNNNGKKDIRALIELKGASINLDTRQKRIGDTRSPVEQAFGYAPKYGKNCHWIIVSNFKEIRLYHANSMLEYQVFFLENLKDDLEFKKFIYVLSFYALVGTENKKAKSLELSEEYQKVQTEIEKKFYNEYKEIRIEIFNNMKNNNPEVSEMIIIEKVQKLLDRFLFICFCEDKGLIPINSYINLVKRGEILEDIFESFKTFCNWINSGNKNKNIPYFNGGLFKPDPILDNLFVDDEVFKKLERIANYDFDSDINERILGHIFEQSISDIEELKAASLNEKVDKKDSKRKKDGIFYTPKYITKYIVEATINSWIDDKKKELGEDNLPELTEKDFTYDLYKKNYSKNYRKHVEFWEKLRSALRKIKIIDPACGSGAFLIEAFDFLLKYNQMLDEKIFNMTGTKNLFDDTTREILENNIFGVDLNKESIEITKLSLWLRTANKNKTLTTLENNIKCGNSLISDKELTDKAFNWQKEFPKIFEEGGFDIVIGNPPYLRRTAINEKSKINIEKNYFSAYKQYDLYVLFNELGVKIAKLNSYLGFIQPNKFLSSDYGYKLLNYLKLNCSIEIIKNVSLDNVFKEASVYPYIFIYKKINNILPEKLENINLFKLSKKLSGFNDLLKIQEIIEKLENKSIKLEQLVNSVNRGVANTLIEFNENGKYNAIKSTDLSYPYSIYSCENKINYKSIDKENKKILEFKEDLILLPRTVLKIRACIKKDDSHILDRIYYFSNKSSLKNEYLLCLLNSKIMTFFYNYKYGSTKIGGGYIDLKGEQIKNFLVYNIPLEEQKPFIEKANIMLELNKELQNKIQKFKNRLSSNFDLKEFSKKMENFYKLDFKEFLKELGKQKIKLSLLEQDEWEEYFENYKINILKIENQIEMTNKEIDTLIYNLYNLTPEEIEIIENNLK